MEEINMEMHLLEFNDRFSRLENEGLLPPHIIFRFPLFSIIVSLFSFIFPIVIITRYIIIINSV